MKKLLFLVIVISLLNVGNAYAIIPTIDGIIDPDDEWADSIIFGTDINELGISDSWDIKSVYMKIVTGQGFGIDGLYFRVDTWGEPTSEGGPGSGDAEAYLQFYLDYDGDSAADRLVDLNDALEPESGIVGVYRIPPVPPIAANILGDDDDGTDSNFDEIFEIYAPDTLLSTNINFNFGLYAYGDNAGYEDNDRAPDEGFYHPVPEPTSILLLVFGLLGFSITQRRL